MKTYHPFCYTLICVAATAATVQAGTQYSDAVIASSPTAYHRMTENPAAYLDPLVDSSGNGNAGTWGEASSDASTTPASGATGPRPSSGYPGLEADNVGAYYAGAGVPSPEFYDSHNLPTGVYGAANATVSFFMNTGGVPGNDSRIFTTGTFDPNAFEIILGPVNDRTAIMLTTGTGSSHDAKIPGAVLNMTTDTWHHVVVVRNGPNVFDANVYIDGVDYKSSLANTGDTHGITDSTPHIGARHSTSRPGWGAYEGTLDEFVYWNRALSPNEVAGLYSAATIPEPSSVALALFGLLGAVAGRRRS